MITFKNLQVSWNFGKIVSKEIRALMTLYLPVKKENHTPQKCLSCSQNRANVFFFFINTNFHHTKEKYTPHPLLGLSLSQSVDDNRLPSTRWTNHHRRMSRHHRFVKLHNLRLMTHSNPHQMTHTNPHELTHTDAHEMTHTDAHEMIHSNSHENDTY